MTQRRHGLVTVSTKGSPISTFRPTHEFSTKSGSPLPACDNHVRAESHFKTALGVKRAKTIERVGLNVDVSRMGVSISPSS